MLFKTAAALAKSNKNGKICSLAYIETPSSGFPYSTSLAMSAGQPRARVLLKATVVSRIIVVSL
jgi:hypothetical protein